MDTAHWDTSFGNWSPVASESKSQFKCLIVAFKAAIVLQALAICRSTPTGRQQMGETGFCKNLRFSAVSCENLRFPAVFCANLRLPNLLIYRASRKSAKICKNLRKCAFRVRFLPFAVSLLACPGFIWTPSSSTTVVIPMGPQKVALSPQQPPN